MPLQIRRGTTAQRGAITPLPGELIYDTTDNKIYVGTDPATVGGISIAGINAEDAADIAAALFQTGSHSGITFTYNDAAGRIDATVTVAATGPFDGDLTGSVFSDTSTLLVDGVSGRLVGPLATSGLVGDLDTGTFNINSSTGNVNITPTGRTNFGSDTSLVDGDVYITRNSYATGLSAGFTFAQHHNTADSVNFTFYRTRGTGSSQQPIQINDELGEISFIGTGSTGTAALGAVITVTADGASSASNIPTKFGFATNNGTDTSYRAELSSAGIWKINNLGALSGTTINVVDDNNITIGDVRLNADGLSTINTNASLTLFANGTGSVDIESVRIIGSTISTTDSSSITVSQASTFSSNITVDGTLTIGDSIVQNSVNKDYVSTTLQTQGVARVVSGVQNGTYVQLVSTTAETFTTISYNATIYRGCRATIKASWTSNNVFIGEVLLANTTTTVTIVTAQDSGAIINTSPISSLTADYDSETGSIRLRAVTSVSTPSAANYDWTVSYQLFT